MLQTVKKGFTLIELLVVITIIGILATGAVTTFTSQIQKARDSTRISDIKAMQWAVEQVYQDEGSYPKAAAFATFKTDIIDYLPNVPEDSKHGNPCTATWSTTTICGYVYNVGDSNGTAAWGIPDSIYEFSAGFENKGNVNNRSNDDNGNDPIRYEISNNSSAAPNTLWASGTAPTSGNGIALK